MELIRSPKLWSIFLNSNDYLLHQCIGSGSFGDVYAVTKITTGKMWALKRVVARQNIHKDRYVMAEIKALMELEHPHIVALEEVIVCDRLACVVLELASGGNLEMMMAQCRADITSAFIGRAFRQILEAVTYCHSAYLAHRDINPSNILIFANSLVKLADFGLSVRCRDPITGEVILCTDYLGQNAYLAPEVRCHRPFPAQAADIWSLGCLLYFLMNAVSPPDNEKEYMALVERTDNNAPAQVIGQLCRVKPADRPQAAEMLALWRT